MSVKLDVIASSPELSTGQLTDQVDRILHSEAFRGSEILRNLLAYLATSSTERRSEPPKVKEIAKTVFGRSEHFDSQSDSVVRVHTGRLRSKLAEYYMSEGVDDDLIITIPKGIYALSWHPRQTPSTASNPASEPEPVSFQPSAAPVEVSRGRRSISVSTAVILVIAAVAGTLGVNYFVRRQSKTAGNSTELRAFWQPFLSTTDAPLIVFSNFRFTGSIATGLHRLDGASDKDKPVIDTYTTMGEVMGVFQVGRLLSAWNQPVRAKRSKLLTWDEAKDSNLIFVGGPLAETPMRDVPVLKDLQFRDGPSSPDRRAGSVLNLHPRPGEQPVYFGSEARYNGAASSNDNFDYAVVALRPALTSNHSILVLAGISEFGTQGAADFVTRQEQVSELLSKLLWKRGAPVPRFEALLRVEIEGGVPIQSQIVLVHKVD